MSYSPHPSAGTAEALIFSARPPESRQRLLSRLAPTGGLLPAPSSDLVTGGEAVPNLDAYDAYVLDGDPGTWEPDLIERLGRQVELGKVLLTLAGPGLDLASSHAQVPTAYPRTVSPPSEWMVTVVLTTSDLARRLPPEFSVIDSFQPLVPHAGDEVVFSISRGFAHHPVLTTRRHGRGRLVTCALGHSDESLASPHLGRALGRALSSAWEARQQEGRPLGLAVVGYGPYGGMGRYHGLAASTTDGLEFVAACDPSPERRKAAEKEFPGVATYAEVDEVLADEAVDVVVVATPPAVHLEVASAGLRAGKHVACEKPLCFTAAEADQLIAIAAQVGRSLTVHQNRRWDPDFLAVRRAVDTGLLGQVFCAETFVGTFEHPCRAWHSEESVSGGAVYDWGSHYLDWILLLMGGPPTRVTARGHKRVWHDVTNLDQVRVHLDWADGREAEFIHSDVAAWRRPKFYIQGTAGTLVGHYRPVTFERIEPGRGFVAEQAHFAEAPADLMLARYEPSWGVTETRLPPAPQEPFAFHANLADHLHLGEPLAVTPESARDVIAVLEAAQAGTA
ncbi:MAG: Gfo/Idh/MocA family oxidoreductase [Acidimicrobiales bacterium]